MYDYDRELVWCPECEDVFDIKRYDNEMSVFILACGHDYDPYEPGEPLEEPAGVLDEYFDIIVFFAFLAFAGILIGMIVQASVL